MLAGGVKHLGTYTGIILSREKHLECGREERFLKSEEPLAPPIVCSCSLLWVM